MMKNAEIHRTAELGVKATAEEWAVIIAKWYPLNDQVSFSRKDLDYSDETGFLLTEDQEIASFFFGKAEPVLGISSADADTFLAYLLARKHLPPLEIVAVVDEKAHRFGRNVGEEHLDMVLFRAYGLILQQAVATGEVPVLSDGRAAELYSFLCDAQR